MTTEDDAATKPLQEHRDNLGFRVADAADEVADFGERIVAAGRRIAAAATQRPGQGLARLRELRRRNRLPLENLYDLHPEARRAPRRQLGLLTIPVARIRGTAVEGSPQRGRDFLPLPMLRSANWQARWQRLRQAHDRLAILPPIDVVQTSEGFWVVDGHNRVALALYHDQDDIDASVTHLHLPGETDDDVHAGSLATVLDDARQVRAAGEGRLARGGTARRQRRQAPQEPADSEP
jgi:hypothetical protein